MDNTVSPMAMAKEFLGERNVVKYTDVEAVKGMLDVLDELLDTLRIAYFDNTREDFEQKLINLLYTVYLLAFRLSIDAEKSLEVRHRDMMGLKGATTELIRQVENA